MRYILFLLLSVFSASSFSAGWVWTDNGSSFSSAQALCNAGVWRVSPNTVDSVSASVSPIVQGQLYSVDCRITYSDAQGNHGSTSFGGTGVPGECPQGQTSNTTTGTCDAPAADKCEAKKDKTANFTFNSNTDMPPQSVPIDGCTATVTKAQCYYASAGKAICTGTASYTGVSGAPVSFGDASECPGGVCPDQKLDPEKKNQDCVYITNGNGVSSCTAQNYESNPGKAQCGSVNGQYTCIENPKASSTQSTLNSTKTPTTNSNGTVTIVKDNTVTTIKCDGKSCTSSTSHSTGSTTTNSSGQVVDNSSSCTGKHCSSTGEATQGGDSSGDEEGDGDSPSVATLKAPTKGSFDGQGNDWDGKINDAKIKFQDGIDKIKDSFKPMGDVSLGGGSKLYCPPPVEVLGHTIDICLDKYADKLSWIADAILALCAMVALVIIFS